VDKCNEFVVSVVQLRECGSKKNGYTNDKGTPLGLQPQKVDYRSTYPSLLLKRTNQNDCSVTAAQAADPGQTNLILVLVIETARLVGRKFRLQLQGHHKPKKFPICSGDRNACL
jgi:hypothetical protein